MENFPHIAASLQTVQKKTAELGQVSQHGLEGPAAYDRLQTIVKHIESYLGQLSEGISNIGESSYMGDNVPKRASQGTASVIAAALNSLAQSIANAEESFSDEASSRLKSLLEDFEKVEQYFSEFTEVSGGSTDSYMPGLCNMLRRNVDAAFETVGGR